MATDPPPTLGPTVHSISWYNRVVSWTNRLVRAWFRLQVSHRGGKYSLERLLALEEYTRTTSISRVFLVCLGMPLPTTFVVLVQELIPLQEPSEGPLANYGFWIRVALLTGLVAFTAAIQAQFFVDRINFSRRQFLLNFCFVGVTFSITMIGIASAVGFPIAFILVTALPVFYFILLVSFRITAGWRFFEDMAKDRRQLIKYVSFIALQGLMIIVYPAYQALFTVVIDTRFEIPVILFLPFIKLTMKYLLSLATTHVEDLMPESVIFTAEFFNSLYVATFMQRTSSPVTLVTMATFDVCQGIVHLFNFHRRVRKIRAHVLGQTTPHGLLGSISSLLDNPDTYKTQVMARVRIRSNLPYQLSDARRALLDTLAASLRSKSSALTSGYRIKPMRYDSNDGEPLPNGIGPTSNQLGRSKRLGRIQPLEVVNSARGGGLRRSIHSPESLVLRGTLEAVFTTECQILTEYLESLIPVFYCCMVLTIVRLPNAQYHMDLEGVTIDNALTAIHGVFTLASVKILYFAIYVAVLQRSCGLSVLHQLAFVLETQMVLVQDKVALWVLVTFAFRVVHFGVDFTFKFSWMNP